MDYVPGPKGPFSEGTEPKHSRIRKTRNVITYGDTPEFRHFLSLGGYIPPQPYEVYHETAEMPRGYPYMVQTYLPNGNSSHYFGPASNGWGVAVYAEPTPTQSNDQLDKLAMRTLTKLKQQSVNLGQVLAERKQTAKLIVDSALKIVSALGFIRRGSFVKAAKRLGCSLKKNHGLNTRKGVASNWLALQYGWQPLLSDIYGSAQALARLDQPAYLKPTRVTSRSALILENGGDPYYLVTGCRGMWKGISLVEYRYVIDYTVDESTLHRLTSVGLTNPLMVAWELMPWSFVVDWALPIGNWVNTFDSTLGLKFVGGHWIQYTTADLELFTGADRTLGQMRYQWESGYYQARLKRYKRGVLTNFPEPVFPSVKDPVSGYHVANALSLLTQAFRR